MTSFLLDTKNNIMYGYSFFEVDSKQRILQDIKTKVNMLLGENPFDKSQGFNFIEPMKNYDTQDLINQIQDKCKEIEGIENLLVSYNTENNKLNITIKSGGQTINV